MRTFADIHGRSWSVGLDAFTLGDVRDELKLDLADAAGWHTLETDVIQLVRALAVICREEITKQKLTAKAFSQAIVGQAINAARDAVLGAAADFFPPSLWSEIRSACKQRQEAKEQWAAIRPMMAVLDSQDMPEAMRNAVMAALAEMLHSSASIDSQSSAAIASAPGPGESRKNAASGSPGSAESAHGG